jgi:threonine synthase
LSSDFFDTIENLSNEEIAFEAIKQFIGDEIPPVLKKLLPIHCALISVVEVEKGIYSLELFHAHNGFQGRRSRFMSRCLAFSIKTKRQ